MNKLNNLQEVKLEIENRNLKENEFEINKLIKHSKSVQ